LPSWPQYCRATPTECSPFFGKPSDALARARHHQADAIISQRPGTVRVTNHRSQAPRHKPKTAIHCRLLLGEHISLHPLTPEALR